MKPTFRAHSGPHERSRLLLFLVSVLVLAAGVAPALAEDEAPALSPAEIEEIERDMERMEQERGEISKAGGITCTDDYCEGLYDDLIGFVWLRNNGFAAIRVATAVEPFIAASSQNCLYDTTLYTVLGNDTTVKREVARQWAGELQVARAMGYVIRIQWVQSNLSGWPACFVYQLNVFGPPAS